MPSGKIFSEVHLKENSFRIIRSILKSILKEIVDMVDKNNLCLSDRKINYVNTGKGINIS